MISRILASRAAWAALLLVAVPLVSSCFAIADLDRFEPSPDIIITFEAFDVAEGKRVEFRMVTDELTPRFLGSGVIDDFTQQITIGGETRPFTVSFINALPSGTLPLLQMYVDEDGDGVFTVGDPFFQLPVSGSLVVNNPETSSGRYDEPPAVLPPMGVDLTLQSYEMFHPTQLFEMKVVRDSDGATIGYYRVVGVGADRRVLIPNVFESMAGIHFEFYADAMANGSYNDPPQDHCWNQTPAQLDARPERAGCPTNWCFAHDNIWLPLPSFQAEAR